MKSFTFLLIFLSIRSLALPWGSDAYISQNIFSVDSNSQRTCGYIKSLSQEGTVLNLLKASMKAAKNCSFMHTNIDDYCDCVGFDPNDGDYAIQEGLRIMHSTLDHLNKDKELKADFDKLMNEASSLEEKRLKNNRPSCLKNEGTLFAGGKNSYFYRYLEQETVMGENRHTRKSKETFDRDCSSIQRSLVELDRKILEKVSESESQLKITDGNVFFSYVEGFQIFHESGPEDLYAGELEGMRSLEALKKFSSNIDPKFEKNLDHLFCQENRREDVLSRLEGIISLEDERFKKSKTFYRGLLDKRMENFSLQKSLAREIRKLDAFIKGGGKKESILAIQNTIQDLKDKIKKNEDELSLVTGKLKEMIDEINKDLKISPKVSWSSFESFLISKMERGDYYYVATESMSFKSSKPINAQETDFHTRLPSQRPLDYIEIKTGNLLSEMNSFLDIAPPSKESDQKVIKNDESDAVAFVPSVSSSSEGEPSDTSRDEVDYEEEVVATDQLIIEKGQSGNVNQVITPNYDFKPMPYTFDQSRPDKKVLQDIGDVDDRYKELDKQLEKILSKKESLSSDNQNVAQKKGEEESEKVKKLLEVIKEMRGTVSSLEKQVASNAKKNEKLKKANTPKEEKKLERTRAQNRVNQKVVSKDRKNLVDRHTASPSIIGHSGKSSFAGSSGGNITEVQSSEIPSETFLEVPTTPVYEGLTLQKQINSSSDLMSNYKLERVELNSLGTNTVNTLPENYASLPEEKRDEILRSILLKNESALVKIGDDGAVFSIKREKSDQKALNLKGEVQRSIVRLRGLESLLLSSKKE